MPTLIQKIRPAALIALCCLGLLYFASPARADLPPALLLEDVARPIPGVASPSATPEKPVYLAGLWDKISGIFSSNNDAEKTSETAPQEPTAPSRETPATGSASPDETFDHFATGFPLTGFHLQVECESCHVGGNFEDTPSKCVSCHDSGGFVQTSSKPGNHPRTTNSCDNCHTTSDWNKLLRVDHLRQLPQRHHGLRKIRNAHSKLQ